jgi:ferredoxin-NADP reductase/ferredoxin
MHLARYIEFEGASYLLGADENILDCLLRQGCDIAAGCRAGLCQTCVLALAPENRTAAIGGLNQKGLSEQRKQAGHILSCQSRPEKSIALQRVDTAAYSYTSSVLAKDWLNKSVLRLRLSVPEAFYYEPGQYVTLSRAKQYARSYSLASVASLDNFLELHIRHYAEGIVSDWLAKTVQHGDSLTLQGPMGGCYYAGDAATQSLLLIATGTGLAPIYGILRQALYSGHAGPIELLVAEQNATRLYYVEALLQLAKEFENLKLTFVIENEQACLNTQSVNVEISDIYTYCEGQITLLADKKIYLCGGAGFVSKLRKQLFLAGARSSNILADSFIY